MKHLILFLLFIPMAYTAPYVANPSRVNVAPEPCSVNFWEGELKYQVREKGLVFYPYKALDLLTGSQREYIQTLSPVTSECVNVKTSDLKLSSVSYSLLGHSVNLTEEIQVDDVERDLITSHMDMIIDKSGFLRGLRIPTQTSDRGQRLKKTMAFIFILDPEFLQSLSHRHIHPVGHPYRVYENSVLGQCLTQYVSFFPQGSQKLTFPPLVNFTNLTPSDEFLSPDNVNQFCDPADQFIITKEVDTDACQHEYSPSTQPSQSRLMSHYLLCGVGRKEDGQFSFFRILKVYQEGAGAIAEGGAVYLLTEVSLISLKPQYQERVEQKHQQVSSQPLPQQYSQTQFYQQPHQQQQYQQPQQQQQYQQQPQQQQQYQQQPQKQQQYQQQPQQQAPVPVVKT